MSGPWETAPRYRTLPRPGSSTRPPASTLCGRAANLLAAQDERPMQPYRFRSLGQVATLGRKHGIADLNGIRMSGLAARINEMSPRTSTGPFNSATGP